MPEQHDLIAPSPAPEIDGWLARLEAELPEVPPDGADPEVRLALLELARLAAHASHRTAAPISTYLVGLAVSSLPRGERAARIRAIAARLESAAG